MTLEDTLADLRERVTMLRVEGHPVQAAGALDAVRDVAIANKRVADRYIKTREDTLRTTFEAMDQGEVE